jgi:hypothetical protein
VINNPQPGDIGDAFSVYIHNTKNKAYKPYAIRAANVVSAAAKMTVNRNDLKDNTFKPGNAAWKADSWKAIWPDPKRWDDISKSEITAADVPTWEIDSTCDPKKWESETACFGVWHPWIVVPLKEPTKTAKGQIQAYHWLADESPDDPTKVFTINYDDALTMLIWESLTPSPMQPDLSHLAKVFMDHTDNDG